MSDLLNSLIPILEVAVPAFVVALLAVGVVLVLRRVTTWRRCGLRIASILITQLIVTAFLAASVVYIQFTVRQAEQVMAAGLATMYAIVMWVFALVVTVATVLITIARTNSLAATSGGQQ